MHANMMRINKVRAHIPSIFQSLLLSVGRIDGSEGIQPTPFLGLPSNGFCKRGIATKRFLPHKQRRFVG